MDDDSGDLVFVPGTASACAAAPRSEFTPRTVEADTSRVSRKIVVRPVTVIDHESAAPGSTHRRPGSRGGAGVEIMERTPSRVFCMTSSCGCDSGRARAVRP